MNNFVRSLYVEPATPWNDGHQPYLDNGWSTVVDERGLRHLVHRVRLPLLLGPIVYGHWNRTTIYISHSQQNKNLLSSNHIIPVLLGLLFAKARKKSVLGSSINARGIVYSIVICFLISSTRFNIKMWRKHPQKDRRPPKVQILKSPGIFFKKSAKPNWV